MNRMIATATLAFVLAGSIRGQSQPHAFSNEEGQIIQDRIVKYDWEKKMVTLEKKGSFPLSAFKQEDQQYILRWNQIEGFKSTMRFKMEVERKNWASMKHEQNVTPYFMDAVQIPGKKTPTHFIVMLEEYEEFNAIYLEAEGFTLKLRNQNFFPLEDIVVESNIFYEQERYVLSDSMFNSSKNEYTDTTTTNKVAFSAETIPVIVPREEVFIDSNCAITIDHQINRTSLVSENDEEGEEGDEEEEGEEAEAAATVEGFGEWDDHARRRKGDVAGVWFRVGIKDLDGNMLWREIASPTSIPSKFSWSEGGAGL